MHPSFRPIIALALSAILAGTLLTGCFTGIESTPKITYKEDKNTVAASPLEQEAARILHPQEFSRWKPGKQFIITSDRANILLQSPDGEIIYGDTITWTGSRNAVALTGDTIVELLFSISRFAEPVVYRTNSTASRLAERPSVEIPFTVDLDMIADARKFLSGRELFIKTPLWYDRLDHPVDGKKFVKIRITDIQPGTEAEPFKIYFTDSDSALHVLHMSVTEAGRRLPRDFSALFTDADPRSNYRTITDEMWEHIINSRPAIGMTKQEAALALGQPQSIDRGQNNAAAYERWQYTDGTFLMFEDGLLIRFKL